MGQSASLSSSDRPPTFAGSGGGGGNGNQQIRHLIDYARDHYQENPTESLAALLQALTLNSGAESAQLAMNRLRNELGDDIANHIGSHHGRMERAVRIVEELCMDKSTFLYEQGREDLLRQTMEDGSSVVCSKCTSVVSSQRWQQHQRYWCPALPCSGMENVHDDDDDIGETKEMEMD